MQPAVAPSRPAPSGHAPLVALSATMSTPRHLTLLTTDGPDGPDGQPPAALLASRHAQPCPRQPSPARLPHVSRTLRLPAAQRPGLPDRYTHWPRRRCSGNALAMPCLASDDRSAPLICLHCIPCLDTDALCTARQSPARCPRLPAAAASTSATALLHASSHLMPLETACESRPGSASRAAAVSRRLAPASLYQRPGTCQPFHRIHTIHRSCARQPVGPDEMVAARVRWRSRPLRAAPARRRSQDAILLCTESGFEAHRPAASRLSRDAHPTCPNKARLARDSWRPAAASTYFGKIRNRNCAEPNVSACSKSSHGAVSHRRCRMPCFGHRR